MFDVLKIALIVGIAAVFVAFVCLGYVAWENAGSRNLALATGTLAAAALLFAIQLRFELRPNSTSDFISAEYTIDRSKPEIRTSYGRDQGHRLGAEIGASTWFANSHPGQFDGDREKLTRDMALFSIFAYLGWQQFDWQIKRVQFKGVSSGTTILTAPGSKPDECSIITTDQIQQMFSNAGNAFAGANISVIGGRLCLPPKTTAELSSNALIVTCPFCEISFTLESSGGIHYGYPGILTDSSYPTLPNGEAAVETRVVGIRIETRYSALRAQHKDMKKYEDWSNRIVSGARDWFEWKEDVTPNVKPPAIQE